MEVIKMCKKNAYITTYSKIHFTPCCPNPEDINIQDIAHSLSLLCRGNGHYKTFHSVAQHSINCCNEAKARGLSNKIQLGCLLHDATEAYLSDITRPVKQFLKKYIEMENTLFDSILQKFHMLPMTQQEYNAIFEIDDHILYFEFLHFMGEKINIKNPYLKSNPDFLQKSFEEAEHCFLQLYDALFNESL